MTNKKKDNIVLHPTHPDSPGKKIIRGLEDAIAIATGEQEPARKTSFMSDGDHTIIVTEENGVEIKRERITMFEYRRRVREAEKRML